MDDTDSIATFVCQIPYAEMKADSYDPSGWLSSMDIVCDGDKSVVYVICTLPQKPSLGHITPYLAKGFEIWASMAWDNTGREKRG